MCSVIGPPYYIDLAVDDVMILRFLLSFCDHFRADDEVVDPKKYLEESCNPKCVKPLLEYQVT